MDFDDFDTRVVKAYQSTLDALHAVELDVSMIDTGGSCKAIWIGGIGGKPFVGAPCAGIMLTAGGPLIDERDGNLNWEAGVYNEDAAQVASLLIYLTDEPSNDAELAAQVHSLAAMLKVDEVERIFQVPLTGSQWDTVEASLSQFVGYLDQQEEDIRALRAIPVKDRYEDPDEAQASVDTDRAGIAEVRAAWEKRS